MRGDDEAVWDLLYVLAKTLDAACRRKNTDGLSGSDCSLSVHRLCGPLIFSSIAKQRGGLRELQGRPHWLPPTFSDPSLTLRSARSDFLRPLTRQLRHPGNASSRDFTADNAAISAPTHGEDRLSPFPGWHCAPAGGCDSDFYAVCNVKVWQMAM